jgi:hypothetical protein
MLDHHLQRSIVYRLAFTSGLRFSELKPDVIDNKLFDYHLKKVVAAGYVMKTNDGLYALTAEGRLLGIRALTMQPALADQAESVLFLIIRQSSDDAWLFYKRSTHPMLGFSGFMHATPNAFEDCTTTAQKACLEKTGLSGAFTVMGSGYSRIFNHQDELESFTHFTVLSCEDAQGQLSEHDEFANYYWDEKPDFQAATMFPSTQLLYEQYEASKQSGQPFFIEQRFSI